MSANATAEQYEAAIAAALREHDVQAAVGLLRVMAVRHPHRAEAVLDTMRLALEIAKT